MQGATANATMDRPRFRQDLVAEVIEDGGAKFIDVGDPDNGQVFRFYEVEFSIACAMDGERDVAGIVQWAKEELGVTPSANEVRSVIATLGSLGYLDQAGAARAAASELPATAGRETELAAGVVVGQAATKPAGAVDVELGGAGATVPTPAPAMPAAGDIALGAPGAAAQAKAPRVPVEDVALGAPGAAAAASPGQRSEVSIDLADHMGVRPDDVKEAVRQSKVMQAVEMPPELAEATDKAAAAKAAAAEKAAAEKAAAEKAAAEKAAAEKAAAEKAAAEKAAAEKAAAEKKATEKAAAEKAAAEKAAADKKAADKKPAAAKPAEKPVVAEKLPVAPQPSGGAGRIVLVLLVLAIVGVGGYFAWRYFMNKPEPTPDTTGSAAPVTPEQPGSAAVAPPPPAPVDPTAKIEIASGAERDILSVFAGPIESIDTTEREVQSSDVLARLVGAKKLEAQMAALDKDIAKLTEQLNAASAARDKANTDGNAAAATRHSAQIDKLDAALREKQDTRTTKEDALEKLYVRAPFEGKVTVLAKPGQKLAENVVVAKIVPKPAPTALFKLENNTTLERGLAIPVAVGEKLITCHVADSTVDGTRVTCPEDPALVAGTDVALKVP